MASTSKSEANEVVGYIHNVSPVMDSQNSPTKYFDATLQEADKTSRVVVFCPKRHSEFVNAEKDRSPVQMTNVRFQPSRVNVGAVDVVVNDRTQLSLKRKLDFAFDGSVQCVIAEMTLQQLLCDPRENVEFSVCVKIVELKDSGTLSTRRGPRERSVFAVADGTASMDLTVWGKREVTVGKWYRCTRVSLTQFMGKLSLNSNIRSAMSIIADQGHVVDVGSDVQEVNVEIVGAKVKRAFYCPMRHAVQNVNESTVCSRCLQCDMSYQNKRFKSELRAEMNVMHDNGTVSKVNVDDKVLRQAVPLSNTNSDCFSVESEICKHDRVHLQLRDLQVLAMDFGQAASVTEACSDLISATGGTPDGVDVVQHCVAGDSDLGDASGVMFGHLADVDGSSSGVDRHQNQAKVKGPKGRKSMQ